MVVVGMRDIVQLLERWQLDVGEVPETHVSITNASGAGTVARSLALGPRLDRIGGSRGTGTGFPYHRHVGHCLRQRRCCGPFLRAVGWFPPALDGDQQAQVKGLIGNFSRRW